MAGNPLPGTGGLITATVTKASYIQAVPPGLERVWWDENFFYRLPLLLSPNQPLTPTPGITTVLEIELDTTSLISTTQMRPDGHDLRVVYWDQPTGWRELPRRVSALSSPTTTVRFPLQSAITTVSDRYLPLLRQLGSRHTAAARRDRHPAAGAQ